MKYCVIKTALQLKRQSALYYFSFFPPAGYNLLCQTNVRYVQLQYFLWCNGICCFSWGTSG